MLVTLSEKKDRNGSDLSMEEQRFSKIIYRHIHDEGGENNVD